MKRKLALFTAALACVTVLLGGCSFLALGGLAGILAGGSSSSDPGGIPEGEPVWFEKIVLTTAGTSIETDELEIARTADGVELRSYRGSWVYDGEVSREDCLVRRIAAGEETFEKLARLLGGCGVRAWDGFSESDPRVLDGSSFHLRIDLSDGGSVEASGTNAYPPRYGDFVRGIAACFDE